MTKSIVPVKPKFPNAMVPKAKTELSVYSWWKKKWGLEPKEITREEALQEVRIVHDPLKGEITWTTKNLDGLGTILQTVEATVLMPALISADAAISICEYFTQGQGQLDLGTGEGGVVVALKDGKLKIDWAPKDVPAPTVAAKKLLAVALLYLISKDAGLPIENILRVINE